MHKEEEVPVKTYFLTTCVSCNVLTLICGIFIYYIYGIMFLLNIIKHVKIVINRIYGNIFYHR